jgi:hypothetical protein
MNRRGATARMGILACLLTFGFGEDPNEMQAEQPLETIVGPLSRTPMDSGSCQCDVYVYVYDDSCGAGCGLIGTKEWHKTWWSSPSENQCIQWCQGNAWIKGGAACDQHMPSSASAVLDWSGRWGFHPYFFFEQQYACSDL